jgi:hypothetical protein
MAKLFHKKGSKEMVTPDIPPAEARGNETPSIQPTLARR